jgi:hypothetical protein
MAVMARASSISFCDAPLDFQRARVFSRLNFQLPWKGWRSAAAAGEPPYPVGELLAPVEEGEETFDGLRSHPSARRVAKRTRRNCTGGSLTGLVGSCE